MLVGYWLVLAAVGLERLYELRLSNANAAWAFSQGAVETGQRHYRFMTVMHTAFLIGCAVEPLVFARAVSLPVAAVFLGLAASSQVLRYWAISTLGPRWNTRVIVIPNASPVTHGPYRYLRHPNYVAVIVELFALPMIVGSVFTAVSFSLTNAVLLWVRIRAEEAAMGTPYQSAFSSRSRFLPRLY
jgi:methyltransferase